MPVANAGFPQPGTVNLPIYRDDDVYAPFRLYTYETDENGNPVLDEDGEVVKTYYDLTGLTVEAQVRHAPGQSVLLELTVDVPTQTGDDVGVFIVSATKEETAVLPRMVARWDVQVTGDTRRTWMKGAVPITGDITREEEP